MIVPRLNNRMLAEEYLKEVYKQLFSELDKVLVGQTAAKRIIAASMMCDTNARILINGKMGAGKTKLIKFLASAFNAERISITNDLLPSDIIEQLKDKRDLQFLKLDELNRMSGKTQSAFIELLEENQMTTKEKVYPFHDFYTFATQNNSDISGIFPIPEAVYDRFDVSIYFEELTEAEERYLLFGKFKPATQMNFNANLLKGTKEIIENTDCNQQDVDVLMDSFSYLKKMTLEEEKLFAGTNERGNEFMIKLAKLTALLNGRRDIIPSDIAFYIKSVYMHRINQSIADIGSQRVLDEFAKAEQEILKRKRERRK